MKILFTICILIFCSSVFSLDLDILGLFKKEKNQELHYQNNSPFPLIEKKKSSYSFYEAVNAAATNIGIFILLHNDKNNLILPKEVSPIGHALIKDLYKMRIIDIYNRDSLSFEEKIILKNIWIVSLKYNGKYVFSKMYILDDNWYFQFTFPKRRLY